MSEPRTNVKERAGGSVAKSWLRALELTAPIANNPDRIFPVVIDEQAATLGEAPALLSDRECLTYGALARRQNQYARWALNQGLAKGDTVCLLMPNRPEYIAIWLGIVKVGGVAALLNTNLAGASLAHCIDIVAPKHIIAAAELADRLISALSDCKCAPEIWIHGASDASDTSDTSYRRMDFEIERHAGEALNEQERRPVTIEDRALCIYTSGTTGLPKAANVSHGRLMQWSHWFAGMMDTQSTDRMYNCMPMYHGVGGVQAPGAILVGGGSMVIRERFSASQFWSDVIRWDCTLFQYIGELCRYLLHTEPSPHETGHRIRLACGNGLRPDVWGDFQRRFRIPQVFEFYAATESGVSLFNVEGEAGAIGRIPPYLAHRFPVVLIQFDVEQGEPVRNERGFCIRCAPNEVGEAIGPLLKGASNVGSRFEGYTDAKSSEKRIVRDVFEPGDAWFRTGDLMRKDARGFFYFVDRIGDTFRWKGENVATSEVAEAICSFPGIAEANVYGVAIPGADGRAGMATLVLTGELDLSLFRAHLTGRLPSYACPLFLRIRNELEVTTTFKYAKTDLVRQGYDPLATTDIIYYNHPDHACFVRLDKRLYDCIQTGQGHPEQSHAQQSHAEQSHAEQSHAGEIRAGERITTGRNELAQVSSDRSHSETERAAKHAV
jgi:fatty-acyl-CoA synthase